VKTVTVSVTFDLYFNVFHIVIHNYC